MKPLPFTHHSTRLIIHSLTHSLTHSTIITPSPSLQHSQHWTHTHSHIDPSYLTTSSFTHSLTHSLTVAP
jgi:hypothetical protein